MAYEIIRNKYYVEVIYFNNNNSNTSVEFDNDARDYDKESAMRANRKVLSYGLNNIWSHFVTITFDDSKIDVNDRKLLIKSVVRYFDYFRQFVDSGFRYILIPEIGSKGRLHFHGLVNITDYKNLKYLYYDKKYKTRVYRDNILFEKLGANKFIKIRLATEYITYYICKYINKSSEKLFNRYYWCSKGLKTDEKLALSYKQKDAIYTKLIDSSIPVNFKNQFLTKYKLTCEQYDYLIKNDVLVMDRQALKAKFDNLKNGWGTGKE